MLEDKIRVAGGNPWPCTSDVWRIEVPDAVLKRRADDDRLKP